MSDYILHMEDGTELYHHGVKGMKWGIRRYQNKDGTLTDKGRKRAGLSSSRKLFSFNKSSDKTASKKPAKRKLKDLSDDELRARVNRIKLEQEYKDLVKPKKTKDRSALFKSVGKDIYQKFLLPAGQDVAKNLVAPYIVNKLGTMINKKVGIDIIDIAYSMNKSKQSDQQSNTQQSTQPQNQPKQNNQPQNQPQNQPKQNNQPQNQPKQNNQPQNQPKQNNQPQNQPKQNNQPKQLDRKADEYIRNTKEYQDILDLYKNTKYATIQQQNNQPQNQPKQNKLSDDELNKLISELFGRS